MSDQTAPLISVITVVRNDPSGLQLTLASVDTQVSKDFEWIIVDGASTDGTASMIAAINRPNLRWLSEPDAGIYDAMNKGIALSKGKFLIFMNAGDQFAGESVLANFSAVAENGQAIDIFYGSAFQATASGLFYKASRSARTIQYKMFTHHQAMFFARRLFPKFGYETCWKIAGDYALVSTAYKNGCKFQRLEFPVCIFSEGGISTTREALGRHEVLRVQKEILGLGWARRTSNLFAAWISSIARSAPLRPIYNRLRYQAVQISRADQ